MCLDILIIEETFHILSEVGACKLKMFNLSSRNSVFFTQNLDKDIY